MMKFADWWLFTHRLYLPDAETHSKDDVEFAVIGAALIGLGILNLI